VFERQLGRQSVQNILWDGDKLGESTMLPVIATGNAQHAAILA
jgi:hypothetical protein